MSNRRRNDLSLVSRCFFASSSYQKNPIFAQIFAITLLCDKAAAISRLFTFGGRRTRLQKLVSNEWSPFFAIAAKFYPLLHKFKVGSPFFAIKSQLNLLSPRSCNNTNTISISRQSFLCVIYFELMIWYRSDFDCQDKFKFQCKHVWYKIEIFLTVDSYDSTSSCKTALLIPFTIIVYYIQLGQKEAGDIKIQMHAFRGSSSISFRNRERKAIS